MSDDDAKGQLIMPGMPAPLMDEDDAKALLQHLLTFDGPVSKLKGACLKLRDLQRDEAACAIEDEIENMECVIAGEHAHAWNAAYGTKAPAPVPEAEELHNKVQ
jgi:hypothetical protein